MRLYHLRLLFTHRKVFRGYVVLVHGRTVVNFEDDTFGYYTNDMIPRQLTWSTTIDTQMHKPLLDTIRSNAIH